MVRRLRRCQRGHLKTEENTEESTGRCIACQRFRDRQRPERERRDEEESRSDLSGPTIIHKARTGKLRRKSGGGTVAPVMVAVHPDIRDRLRVAAQKRARQISNLAEIAIEHFLSLPEEETIDMISYSQRVGASREWYPEKDDS